MFGCSHRWYCTYTLSFLTCTPTCAVHVCIKHTIWVHSILSIFHTHKSYNTCPPMSYMFASLVLYLHMFISKIHVHLFTCVIHITYPNQTHVYKCSFMTLHNPDLVLNFHRYSYDIAISHTVRCTWNMMLENCCKYTHDRTTMLPEIHNASIFYGTQSVTPDTSTSHMRLAEYSQTKEIHSPHLKHPPWFTGCSKKK